MNSSAAVIVNPATNAGANFIVPIRIRQGNSPIVTGDFLVDGHKHNKRIDFTITNAHATSLANYPAKVEINTQELVRQNLTAILADGDELQFASNDADSDTEPTSKYYYWFPKQRWEATDTPFWINIPAIDGSGTLSMSLYLSAERTETSSYYGNQAGTAGDLGSNKPFDFGDCWERTPSATVGNSWTEDEDPTDIWAVNNWYWLEGTGDGNDNNWNIYKAHGLTSGYYQLEVSAISAQSTPGANDRFTVWLFGAAAAAERSTFIGFDGSLDIKYFDSGGTKTGASDIGVRNFHRYQILYKFDSAAGANERFRAYLDDVVQHADSDQTPYTTAYGTLGRVYFQMHNFSGDKIQCDYIFIRNRHDTAGNLVTSEPTNNFPDLKKAFSAIYDENHCASFPDDIQPYSAAGAALDHYVREISATEAWLFVEVAADLSSTEQTVTLKWGESGFSSQSNGPNTFPKWDDFRDYEAAEDPKAARGWTWTEDAAGNVDAVDDGTFMCMQLVKSSSGTVSGVKWAGVDWTAKWPPYLMTHYRVKRSNNDLGMYLNYTLETDSDPDVSASVVTRTAGGGLKWYDGSDWQNCDPATDLAVNTWYDVYFIEFINDRPSATTYDADENQGHVLLVIDGEPDFTQVTRIANRRNGMPTGANKPTLTVEMPRVGSTETAGNIRLSDCWLQPFVWPRPVVKSIGERQSLTTFAGWII